MVQRRERIHEDLDFGFVFLSVEDETGVANFILTPDGFEGDRIIATGGRFLRIEALLLNQDGVIHIKAQNIAMLGITVVCPVFCASEELV